MIKLNLSSCVTFEHHRYGWKYCINQIKSLHSKSGIFCDGYIEYTFITNRQNKLEILPHKMPWIGFMHNPPNGPSWLDKSNCCDYIMDSDEFINSLHNCKCIITLSEYLKTWLSKKIKVPIIDIKYATNLNVKKWDAKIFLKQKHIPLIQIGYWLRNIQFIRDINCSSRYVKIWLPSSYEYARKLINKFADSLGDSRDKINKWRTVSIPRSITDSEYDSIMSRCVVCLDLYDASANTSILDCIARNTPLIVNKLPAVVEYLGEDYPLYCSNEQEAKDILSNVDLIISANQYLKNMDKTKFTGSYFCMNLNRKLREVL